MEWSQKTNSQRCPLVRWRGRSTRPWTKLGRRNGRKSSATPSTLTTVARSPRMSWRSALLCLICFSPSGSCSCLCSVFNSHGNVMYLSFFSVLRPGHSGLAVCIFCSVSLSLSLWIYVLLGKVKKNIWLCRCVTNICTTCRQILGVEIDKLRQYTVQTQYTTQRQ